MVNRTFSVSLLLMVCLIYGLSAGLQTEVCANSKNQVGDGLIISLTQTLHNTKLILFTCNHMNAMVYKSQSMKTGSGCIALINNKTRSQKARNNPQQSIVKINPISHRSTILYLSICGLTVIIIAMYVPPHFS
jgi:hypothetical protein